MVGGFLQIAICHTGLTLLTDDIANFRAELANFLWEFDDVIDADVFHTEKFTELQTILCNAAQKIQDILIRMGLEDPTKYESQNKASQVPLTVIPNLPPASTLPRIKLPPPSVPLPPVPAPRRAVVAEKLSPLIETWSQ